MKKQKIITKKNPEKKLIVFFKKRAGRARSGRITVRHQGGGARRLYRIVDFGQEKLGIPAKLIAVEYDPNRTSFIGLFEYQGGEKRYRLLPQGLKVGDAVLCADETPIKVGNRTKLKNVPVGSQVYNVEIEPGKGGRLMRGAGTSAKILAQEGGFVHLVFSSSEIKKVSGECFASIGQVSFPEHKFINLGKAGRARLLGRRPAVRGTAMNPVDHPHGGGEGRTGIGLKYPKTPWGKPALGVKTRKRKWTDKFIIQRRKKKKGRR